MSPGIPASQSSSASYSVSVTWYRNALPPYSSRVMPPPVMCRTRRSFSAKLSERRLSLCRARGGTANTPSRSVKETVEVFTGTSPKVEVGLRDWRCEECHLWPRACQRRYRHSRGGCEDSPPRRTLCRTPGNRGSSRRYHRRDRLWIRPLRHREGAELRSGQRALVRQRCKHRARETYSG